MRKVPSSRGFDQGCPVSAAALSVAQSAALADYFSELTRLDPAARLYSYLDDTYLVVEAGLAVEALTALERALAPWGLRLNATKTTAWSPAGIAVLPPPLQRHYAASLSVLGKHLRPRGNAEDNPAALGPPANSLAQAADRLRKLWDTLQRLQKTGLTKQATGALLRAYAGAASQRALRQARASDAAAALDGLLTRY